MTKPFPRISRIDADSSSCGSGYNFHSQNPRLSASSAENLLSVLRYPLCFSDRNMNAPLVWISGYHCLYLLSLLPLPSKAGYPAKPFAFKALRENAHCLVGRTSVCFRRA